MVFGNPNMKTGSKPVASLQRPSMAELQPRAMDRTSELDRESSLDGAIGGRQQDRCAVSLPQRYGTLA